MLCADADGIPMGETAEEEERWWFNIDRKGIRERERERAGEKVDRRKPIDRRKTFYASAVDFFRWKRPRVRDLLRGFFSPVDFLSLLTVRPRERPERLSLSPMYLAL